MNKLYLANFHTSLVAFSRALNQRVWWNFMYIQWQFVDTFKSIWRHSKLLKTLLGGNVDRCHYRTLKPLEGRTAGSNSAFPAVTITVSAVFVEGALNLRLKWLRRLRLTWSISSVAQFSPDGHFICILEHDNLSHLLLFSGEKLGADNGNLERFWLSLNTENH